MYLQQQKTSTIAGDRIRQSFTITDANNQCNAYIKWTLTQNCPCRYICVPAAVMLSLRGCQFPSSQLSTLCPHIHTHTHTHTEDTHTHTHTHTHSHPSSLLRLGFHLPPS